MAQGHASLDESENEYHCGKTVQNIILLLGTISNFDDTDSDCIHIDGVGFYAI